MSTAIALVNRMRAKRRDATSTILTDRQGIAYLDILNGAITAVLESRTWDFQKRSDGELTTRATFSGTSLVATAGSDVIQGAGHTGTANDIGGLFVTRVIVTSDTLYSNTALRLENGTVIAGTFYGNIQDNWQGTTTTTGTWTTICYEYVLPETVKLVLSVKEVESSTDLLFSTSPEEFDREFPRPWDQLSSQPEIVCVGGEVRNTGGATIDYYLALRIWPVPDSEYQLHYTYVMRQPRLTIDTDTLNRCPPAVEDVIVDLAVARVMMELEKDLQTGIPLEAKVLKQVDALHRNHIPASGRRPELLSHDVRTSRNSMLWLPRQVSGLSGS